MQAWVSYEFGQKALIFLNYSHAPTAGVCCLVAFAFSACTLQRPAPLSFRRQQILGLFTLVIAVTYLIETLSYVDWNLADYKRSTPQDAMFHVFSATILWSALTVAVYTTKAPPRPSYIGTFALGLIYEVVLCVHTIGLRDNPGAISVCSSIIRIAVSFVLVGTSFLFLQSIRTKECTNEEATPLLGEGTQQQPERLQEAGNWIEYLRRFAVFLPYLWPKHDWKMLTCLALRATICIQLRVLNVLIPRQLGIITDKISSRSRVMPWREVALWTCYRWLVSSAGLPLIDNFANDYFRFTSGKRIYELAFGHIMSLSLDFHASKDTGEILSSIEQAGSLRNLVEFVTFDCLPILLDMIIAIVYVTRLFDSFIALIVVAMAIAYIWIGLFLVSWIRQKRQLWLEKARRTSKILTESILMWKTVSYFDRIDFERRKYSNAVQAKMDAMYNFSCHFEGGRAIQELVVTLGFTACSIMALLQTISGGKSPGNFVAFLTYWNTIQGPIRQVTGSYQTINSMLVDAERLLELLCMKPSVADPQPSQELVVHSGEVKFKDVEFAYDERRPLLRGVNLVVGPGKTIALVGETGSGKSTILNLLSRFYDVTSGSIEIDGQDVRSISLSSLRTALGVVPQDPMLSNQSISQNIRYARLDASQEDIENVCKEAAIHDKIMAFPDGYETIVGEGGVKLSGGERQRIAIARVLLKNPKIVVLDEATSSVDTSTEAKIQGAFQRLSHGRTTLVVAHRLSTIRRADTILVVQQGSIIEQGTHDELVNKGGKYTELWTQQTG